MAKKKTAKKKSIKRPGGKTENITLRWDFPSTNHGKEDGFSDPAIEYFQGDHEKFIAREAIQNAVDARLDYGKPVTVVFERFIVPAELIPGYEMLSGIMHQCLEFVRGQEKAEIFFRSAIELLNGKKIPILKISDFNTTGLSGSDGDRNGNWYRLVRVTGTSSPKGVAGGSFGIGKGASFAASALRTVFYSSINDKGEAVLQGVARLVSHYNKKKDVRQGVGFYGASDCNAIRNPKLIPDLFKRSSRGTDIFIAGYRSDSNWQEKIFRSVLHNFWLAILNGDLEVVIKDSVSKTISKDTLYKYLEEYDAEDAKFFFESVTNWTQRFDRELKHLGKVALFVRKQDGYPSKIMMARKPRMLVQEKQYRVLREPYAGVLVCDDDRGNQLLRDLEPPAHDKWDKDRALNGFAALRELEDFVKQSLKSMGEAVTSEPQDIPGLDRYLPDSEDRDYTPQEGAAPLSPTEMFSEEETGREVGAAKELSPAEVESVLRRAVIVKSPAAGQGSGRGGKNESNSGDSQGSTGGQEEGEGEGERIRTADINFRSFVQNTKDGLEYRFIINGRENCQGAVRLVAVGDDGSYPVDVKSAVDLDSKNEYAVSGSMIKGLSVASGQTVRLAVKLQSKKKYALGIENYES